MGDGWATQGRVHYRRIDFLSRTTGQHSSLLSKTLTNKKDKDKKVQIQSEYVKKKIDRGLIARVQDHSTFWSRISNRKTMEHSSVRLTPLSPPAEHQHHHRHYHHHHHRYYHHRHNHRHCHRCHPKRHRHRHQ